MPTVIQNTTAAVAAAATAAIANINEQREAVRLMFITPIQGQMTVYERKERAARAFLADANPDPTDKLYRPIYNEVGSTAPTAIEVAQIYVANADAMYDASDELERICIAAITDIEAATTLVEIETRLATFSQEIAQLNTSLSA